MKRPPSVLEDVTRVLADDDMIGDALANLADGYERETYAGVEHMTIDIIRLHAVDEDPRSSIRVRMWRIP